MRAAASSWRWVSGLSLGFQYFIAESREAAMKAAGNYYEENMKMFGELRLVRALSDEQIAAMRDPRLAATSSCPDRGCGEGRRLPGRHAADIIEQLKALEKRYPGLDRVSCGMALHAARRGTGATRPLRQGSDAGLKTVRAAAAE
jgi:hypothetical protein